MTLTKIEKAAKLLGHDLSKVTGTHPHLGLFIDEGAEFRQWFNPYTNKSDLMDVECSLPNICVIMNHKMCIVTVDKDDGTGYEWEASALYADHPDKFTARAHAVMAVVEQIYDAKKDNL